MVVDLEFSSLESQQSQFENWDPFKYLDEAFRREKETSLGEGGWREGKAQTHPSYQLLAVLAFVYILPHLQEESLYFYLVYM